MKIRKIFKDDPLILSLDPIQGKSDNFTVCYNLVKEFSGFGETNERLDLLAIDKLGNLV